MCTSDEQQEENQDKRRDWLRKTEKLTAIIKPLRTAKYEVDCEWRDIQWTLERYARDYGGVDLTPDFQRGHIWTKFQQTAFIENVLRGVISSSGFMVQFNCANWEFDDHDGDLPNGLQCIDGLQRLTAVQRFLDGTIKPFDLSVRDLDRSAYSVQGSSYRFRLAIHNFQSRADLLQHYLDLNVGGTPHASEEITRVRTLLNAAKGNQK